MNIEKVKYVHLMFNDKFNKPMIDFINRRLNSNEHLFLCKRFFAEYAFPKGDNVVEIQSLYQVNWKNLCIEKIFCHSLFDPEVIDFLFEHKEFLKKSYWFMWGGDYYNYPQDVKNIFIRQNFAGYVTNYDKKEVSQKLQKEIEPYKLNYNFPVDKIVLDNCLKRKRENKIVVQINNSCDQSTLEVLDWLAKFAEKDIIIKTVLSYGQLTYKEAIIKKGLEIFNNKFEYLDRILSGKYYANYLAENDILILNQNRSQGIGNTFASLYLGKKIFVRKDISTYLRLVNQGFIIYDTITIKDLSYETFINNPEFIQNVELAKDFFDDELIKSQWEKILFS